MYLKEIQTLLSLKGKLKCILLLQSIKWISKR